MADKRNFIVTVPGSEGGVASIWSPTGEEAELPAWPGLETIVDLANDATGTWWSAVGYDGRQATLWHGRSGRVPDLVLSHNDAIYWSRPDSTGTRVAWLRTPDARFPPRSSVIARLEFRDADGTVRSVGDGRSLPLEWGPAGDELWYTDPAGDLVRQRLGSDTPVQVHVNGRCPRRSPTGARMAYADGRAVFVREGDKAVRVRTMGDVVSIAWQSEDQLLVLRRTGTYDSRIDRLSLEGHLVPVLAFGASRSLEVVAQGMLPQVNV